MQTHIREATHTKVQGEDNPLSVERAHGPRLVRGDNSSPGVIRCTYTCMAQLLRAVLQIRETVQLV